MSGAQRKTPPPDSLPPKGLYLDSAEPIRIFYRLRESLSRLSLAMYFSELVRLSVREHQTPEENCFVMRLMLNTLHYLENGERSEALLKSIFELRLMTELGMMPDLLMCRSCCVFLPKRLYFSVEEGCFFCADCGESAFSDPAPCAGIAGDAAHSLCGL